MKEITKKFIKSAILFSSSLSMSVTVFAEEAEKQNPQLNPFEGMVGMLIIYGAVIALFYLAFMRPQKKKMKQDEAMRNSLQVGDEVVMSGGIIGKIINIKDDEVTIETGAARTQIKFLKSAVARVEKKADDDSKEKSLNEKKAELQRKLDEKKDKNKGKE